MPLHNHALSDKVRMQSIELLNRNLSNSIDLYSQLKCAFWNVQVAGIISIKRLIDINSKSVLDFQNLIGERINALGGNAIGNIQFATENSVLIPYRLGIATELEHGFAISSSIAAFSQEISRAIAISLKIQDYTTADIFSNILRITDASLRRLSLHLDTNHLKLMKVEKEETPFMLIENTSKLEKLI